MSCECKVVISASYGDLDPHIIYCWDHGQNFVNAAERRRYALLQAAAVIYATEEMKYGVGHSAQLAEELLAEIKKQETKES